MSRDSIAPSTVYRQRVAGFLLGLWLSILLGTALPLGAATVTGQKVAAEYQYDPQGNRTKIISPSPKAPAQTIGTDFGYDSLDRNTTITQPQPDIGFANPLTVLGYDGQDRLTSVKDPNDLITEYTYKAGANFSLNLERIDSPDSGATVNNTYDEAGNLKKRTDGRGKITTYAYDALNRLTTVNYTTGIDTFYTYDGGAGDTDPNDDGKISKISDEAGVTTYNYDSRGRLVGKTQNLGEPAPQAQTAWTLSVGYAYGDSGSAVGKLVNITYPSGNRVNYNYNATGRISSITLNPTLANGLGPDLNRTINLLTNINYQPTGEFAIARWGNYSVSADTLYQARNLDGKIIRYRLGNAAQGGLERNVLFNPDGRVKSFGHVGTGIGAFTPANLDQDFTYDDLGRLKTYQIGTNPVHSFDYDLNGNRTATDGYGHHLETGLDGKTTSNRLLATDGPAPAKKNVYDGAGNLTDDGTFTYSYSDRGRLQSVTRKSNNAKTSYVYNGLDQRVRKTPASDVNTTQYFYDEQGHLLGEYDFYGRPLQETVYLGDLPIAVLTQSIPPAAAGSVTVDNTDTAKIAVVGTWVVTADSTAQGGGHQIHAAGTATDRFTWKLALPIPGKYFFQARWNADATRAADAKYTISGANTDGTTIKTIDQTASGNTWVNLGLKAVSAATTVNVNLNANAGGTVSADAVRALPVNNAQTAVHYVYADHINTPRVITRASDNQMVWRWDATDPFGVAQPDQDPSGLGAFKYNPRFPGQVYDAETGLYYNYFRHYEPDTGTYVQSDPIGLAGGINTYTYVNGNPVNWVDPFGLRTEVTIWQPVGWWSSSFGHVSTDINGTVYSYGQKGMWTGAASDYYSKNDFRDGQGVVIPLSPDQEKRLAQCMSKDHGDYSKFTNNCGAPVQDCLKELGIDTGNKMFPASVGNRLLDIGAAPDSQSQHPATTPSQGTSAPWAR